MLTRRASTILCIAALTILSWVYLVHLERQMSAAAADEQTLAIDIGLNAKAVYSIESRSRAQCQAAHFRAVDDRKPDRVFGKLLHTGHERERFVLG